jgi:flagellar protein FlbD
MILLTRFHSGESFAVNPDLIERVEETPDTVITLTNGAKHVVQESMNEIMETVQMFKATTLALAVRIADDPSAGESAHLRVVRGAADIIRPLPPIEPDDSSH